MSNFTFTTANYLNTILEMGDIQNATTKDQTWVDNNVVQKVLLTFS